MGDPVIVHIPQNCYKAHTGIVDNLMEVCVYSRKALSSLDLGKKLRNFLNMTKGLFGFQDSRDLMESTYAHW